ncbi:MAG TPA: ABC transporter ATP-binding protein [Myxococcaceae bacterium]|nr:ABC transporter ATP-binding protein [Myxococcaceae bacterium]
MFQFQVEARVGDLEIAVELSVSEGPLILAGPNGSGKTSLLLLLLGLMRPERGYIAIGAEVLFDSSAGVDLSPEERGLGYVPQEYALFPHLDVFENIAFGLKSLPARLGRTERISRIESLLGEMEIAPLAQRLPRVLSGGEKQRVALARALAPRPRALLLDEPLAALDVGARRQVRAFLATYLAGLQLPAIVVTHDAADAIALGRQVAILERGKVVQRGTYAQIQAQPRTPFVAEFVSAD